MSTGTLGWWRCARCLIRVYIAGAGWTCPGCQQSCESERKALRLMAVQVAERMHRDNRKIGRSSEEFGSSKSTETSTESPLSSILDRARASAAERALKYPSYAGNYAGPFSCHIPGCSALTSGIYTQGYLDYHYQKVHLIAIKATYTCDYETLHRDSPRWLQDRGQGVWSESASSGSSQRGYLLASGPDSRD